MNFKGYGIRPIEKCDLKKILEWRNSDRVRLKMLKNHIITMTEHKKWFEDVADEKPKKHFIFLFEQVALGYISFFNFDKNNCSYSIGVYLGEQRKNFLDGIYLYILATEYGFNNLDAKYLREETLVNNKAALEISRFLGYKDVEMEKFDNTKKLQKLILSKESWQKNMKNRF